MNKFWLAMFGTIALNGCVIAPGDASDTPPETSAEVKQDVGITVSTSTVGVTLKYTPTDLCHGQVQVTADGNKYDALWTFDFYQDGALVGSAVNDRNVCDPTDPACNKPSAIVPVLSTPHNYHVELHAATQSWLLNRKYKGTSNVVAVRPEGPYCGFPPSTRPAYAWSSAGAISDMFCTNVNEGADPHTWNDNYFCSFDDVGLQFAGAGAIPGKVCTSVNEPGDHDAWADNYICSNSTRFTWWWDGAPSKQNCVQWNEPADPDGWDDNFLCY